MGRSVSVILPARSNAAGTSKALTSLALAFASLQLTPQFILINDNSSENALDATLFSFREKNPAYEVIIARTSERFHYTGVFSLGLHLATGSDVFFMSNDMILTTAFLKALFAVADADEKNGIIRGTSNHTDSHPEHTVVPRRSLTRISEFNAFAEAQFQRFGKAYVVDHMLSGDAILIKRSVLNQIGVLDTRFFGYFGDVDFGLRAQIAGFRLVCAKGAWLYHEGAGHIKDEAQGRNHEFEIAYRERMSLVNTAYEAFKSKWRLDERYNLSDFEASFPDILREYSAASLPRQDMPADLLSRVQVSRR